MTDPFADVVMPIFQRVLHLHGQLAWGESRPAEEVLELTRSWIEEGTRKTATRPELARSFELARFGLVTWIDELLTDSTWGADNGWSVGSQLLELALYPPPRKGATRFYDEAERAEEARDDDALEVYLLCLNLGFKGKYRDREEELASYVAHLYERVSEAGSISPRPFNDDDTVKHKFEALRGPTLLLTVSVLVSLTALFTLAAYLFSVHVNYARLG